MSFQDELNRINNTKNLSVRDCFKQLAGGDTNRDTTSLANTYSGTTNRTMQDALNIKAGRNLSTQELLSKQSACKLLPQGSWAFLGDSITNASSGYVASPPNGQPTFMAKGTSSFATAILGYPYTVAHNDRFMNTDGSEGLFDLDFGWDGITADQYANSTTVINTLSGGKYPTETRTPLQVAIASGAKNFVLCIGTNDANGVTAPTILTRINTIVTALRAAGGRVLLCTLLPRTGSGGAGVFQEIIDGVNAGLPAIAEATNSTLVPWHTEVMTNGSQNTSYFYDTTHPNEGGASVLGKKLAEYIRPCVGGPTEIPASNSALWMSANAYMTADSDVNGLADGLVPFYYVDPVYSIYTDSNGMKWQQINERATTPANITYMYGNGISADDMTALKANGKKIRGVCRYEIVSGNITGFTMNAYLIDNGYSAHKTSGYYDAIANDAGVITPHTGLMLTEQFAVPAEATMAQLMVRFYGTGIIRITQFGWIREA